MQINIATPSLLFPAISLLMLAYTNRYLGIATVIRQLHQSHTESPNQIYLQEISSLRRRIRLIRDMQLWGVLGLISCTMSMLLLFRGLQSYGEGVFGISIICMLVSLAISLVEIRISVEALDIHLRGLEKEKIL
ncbi:MAG: DUF2721 domain-containing protein [Fibrobacteria bacterium]